MQQINGVIFLIIQKFKKNDQKIVPKQQQFNNLNYILIIRIFIQNQSINSWPTKEHRIEISHLYCSKNQRYFCKIESIFLKHFQHSIFIQMGAINCCEEKHQQPLNHLASLRRESHSSVIIAAGNPQTNKTNDSNFLPQAHCPRNKRSSLKNTPTRHKNSPYSSQSRQQKKKKRVPEDYQHIKYLGKGAFGCVVLVQQKSTNKRYAMKIIQKNKIKEFNLLQCDRIKNVGHEDFLVPIKQTFQNKTNIYIVMEHLPMGDLYYYLRKKETPFTEDVILNILSEVVVSIGYLHQQGIVYRELKPENLLVTDEGHIKLTDYGLSKVIIEDRKSISTFVGTLEYMAPEAYSGEFGQKADIWSLGIVMYELLFKECLFQIDERNIATNIKQGIFPIERVLIQNKINSKIGYMSLNFRDLMLKLLEEDPDKRISLNQIKTHQFFKDVSWQQVQQRKNPPPLKQMIEKKSLIKFRDPTAEKYFRNEYIKEKTIKSNYQIQLYEFRKSH